MNKYLYIIILSFATLFASCEKMVDLELNSIEPRLVIDASIKDGAECIVLLSLTQDYFDTNSSQSVSNAEVYLSIEGSAASEEKLVQTSGGRYQSVVTKGKIGATYMLRVVVDEKEYRSIATIPEIVHIDRLYVYSLELAGKYWFNPCVAFYDPKGIANYYYFTLKINKNYMRDIYVDDDTSFDGLYKDRILVFNKEDNDDEELKMGDELMVEMHSIDKGAFDFYQSLYSIASGGGTNPISNISGGVLGCFNAYSVSSYTIPHITDDDIFSRKLD